MAGTKKVVSYLLRKATLADAEALVSIYSYYVEKTAITFELETPSLEEFKTRMTNVMKRYPFIVVELDGVIVGYAYASPFKERLAYRFSVESTIYLDQSVRGQGLGKILYTELLNKLKAQNILSVIGVIAITDSGSVALHEKLGFKKIGILPKVGFKLSQWWDVGLWQLDWEKPDIPPEILINY
jgi:L-amino acid N-acyltransferase YncA